MATKARRRRAGRPRGTGEEVVQAVLQAALDELRAGDLHTLRIERVARRAGVAKTSIYRRWPSKPELALAALTLWRDANTRTFVATGDLRTDLVSLLTIQAQRAQRPAARKFVQVLFGSDEPGLRPVRKRLYKMGAKEILDVLNAGIASGQLDADANTALFADSIIAFFVYRALTVRPIRRAEVEQLADDWLSNHTPRRRTRTRTGSRTRTRTATPTPAPTRR